MPQVPLASCFTCSCMLCLIPYMFSCFTCLLSYLLVSYVLVSYMLSVLVSPQCLKCFLSSHTSCPKCSRVLRVSFLMCPVLRAYCLTCSKCSGVLFATHFRCSRSPLVALTLRVSCPIYSHASHVLQVLFLTPLMFYMFQLFQYFFQSVLRLYRFFYAMRQNVVYNMTCPPPDVCVISRFLTKSILF